MKIAINIAMPNIGMLPLEIEAESFDAILTSFEEVGFLDGTHPETGKRGRFFASKIAFVMERVRDRPSPLVRAPGGIDLTKFGLADKN